MQYPHPSPVSLVTGGAGALGAELVRRFATQGDTVVLLDDFHWTTKPPPIDPD